MNKYEMIYILESALSDEAKDQIVEKIDGVITKNGGVVEKTEKWGIKKLAYPIDYKTEGYYVLMNIEAAETVPAELDRQMRNSDAIVRSMIIRK